MRIDGTWSLDENGVLFPLLTGEVLGAGNVWIACEFLVDTGADTTVLAGDILRQLQLPTQPSPRELRGVGGLVETVSVETEIKFTQPNGLPAKVRHRFDAFTDPLASDRSVLGRDILGAFALIVDRPERLIHLLSGRHRYIIQEP